ncbi:MAG TPA: NADP-dependent oxidoreductase [Candidatus Limnocylindria bacterium]|jgi:NADPH:quinone reductase-like Zn-dependent oxidoreductase|nr:NADP-dependent oxidoreductase [Candidatus Limnocylindria bacterium]
MKAAYLVTQSGPDSLIYGEVPKPSPRAGEVLVKVHATAVMPTELLWYPTFKLPSGEPRSFPVILSHEFSGVVESLGNGVQNVKVGDSVYGLNDWFSNGAQAEFCVVSATGLTAKPKSIPFTQAAITPISALTAWQGLFEKGRTERGQRVLIHGGAGAVGSLAVQLARWKGAHVIATAGSSHVDYVRSLGADEVIDYRTTRFERVARDMNVVFDTVGGETLKKSLEILRPAGRIVTVATTSESTTDQRIRDAFLLVRADGAQLAELANLIDRGVLQVLVAGIFPLSQAREAYARAAKGGLRGKIALRVAA